MSTGQVRTMVSLMAQGAPVEVTSMWATVGKLSRLAHLGEQFGYQYADARYVSKGTQLLMVPDTQPQAQQRAQQAWAQFPQAAAGGQLPPLPQQAPELLKTQVHFDLSGRHNEKRRVLAVIPITVVVLLRLMRDGADAAAFWIPFWVFAMCLAVGMVFYHRKQHAKYGAQLQAAGYVQVPDPTGRVHYVPAGSSLAAHAVPMGPPAGQVPPQQQQPYGGQQFGNQAPQVAQQQYQQQPPPQQYQQQEPQQYQQQPYAPQPQQQPQPPAYGQQQPYGGQPQQQPYGQQAPYGQQPPQQY
ncbi:hypothetical protein RCO28_09330 [Streptomyces sp. LHD-70]|uniref:hypothetical protein n=1 Tax=Streptomyces sp. LHD-70 TaxID=3072140 RepID=UPI00280C7922|nr:hypothetical protein [Streptomyces sp. LHD-70]MDQ8702689.1 hypothetical protein [Streptomyces sp. LHD-70]